MWYIPDLSTFFNWNSGHNPRSGLNAASRRAAMPVRRLLCMQHWFSLLRPFHRETPYNPSYSTSDDSWETRSFQTAWCFHPYFRKPHWTNARCTNRELYLGSKQSRQHSRYCYRSFPINNPMGALRAKVLN